MHTGKHFTNNEDGSWNVLDCSRINENSECELCEEYFSIMKEAKAAEDSGDKGAATELKEQARKGGKQVAIQFFYPVLNRDTQSFGILQTTYGVKKKIDDMYNSGVKITERDMTLLNTGKPAAARYTLTVVDSADSGPLSEKEEEAFQKAKDFDVMTINSGGNSGPSEEVEEIPFEEDDQVKAAKEIFTPDE